MNTILSRLSRYAAFALLLQLAVPHASAQVTSLTATEGVFEDRVVLNWAGDIPNAAIVSIYRAEFSISQGLATSTPELLAVRSRTDTEYIDRSGPRVNPANDTVYEYSVTYDDVTFVTAVGWSNTFPPTNANASDLDREDGILITWTDKSEIEASYQVVRLADQTTVELPANASFFLDTTALVGTAYEYCIYAIDAHGIASQAGLSSCDSGQRAAVSPPLAVTASDGQYPDHVRITWTDQSKTEDFFTITADNGTGNLQILATIPGDTTVSTSEVYEDFTATVGLQQNYCVTATSGGVESRSACDAGVRGVLPSPSDVTASVDTFDDQVRISWTDEHDYPETEANQRGYQVLRELATIATVGSGTRSYSDETASQEEDTEYCIRSFSTVAAPDTTFSESVCAVGRRTTVLPPTTVDATDAKFEDRIGVTFEDGSTTAMLFNIYRDNVLIDNVPAATPVFVDTQAPGNVPVNYCVSAVSVSNAFFSRQEAAKMLERAKLQTASRTTSTRTDAQAAFDAFKVDVQNRSSMALSTTAAVAAMGIVESALVCDTGSRELAAPSGLSATYDESEDHVQLSWIDNSKAEAGYTISRTLRGTGRPSGGAMLLSEGYGENTSPTELTSFTFETWVRNSSSISETVFESLTSAGNSLVSLTTEENGSRVRFDCQPCDVSLTSIRTGLNDDRWHHVALTFSAHTQALEFYVDGKLDQTSHSTVAISASVLAVLIDNFGGMLSGLRVWDYPRTAAQIRGGIQDESAANEPGTVYFWPFDDGSGSDALDLGPSGTHLTFSSVTWDLPQVSGTATPFDSVSADRQTYGDFRGVPGIEYTYEVRSFDRRGSGGTSSAAADVGMRNLAAPTAVQASDGTSETEVTITWIDNSRAETGFQIYRDGVPLGSVPANTTSFVDSSPAIAQRHQYSVAANDTRGVSPVASDSGSTDILAPAYVSISDSYDSAVTLVWEDRSAIEIGYEIFLGPQFDNVSLTVPPNTTSHSYQFQVPTEFVADWCIRAVASVNPDVSSDLVCDRGQTTVVNNEFFQRIGPAVSVSYDSYGNSVSMSGNLAMVGAPDDNSAGPQDGTVYLYERNPETSDWRLLQRMASDDTDPAFRDLFGSAVSVSGTNVVVGAQAHINNASTGRAIFYEVNGSELSPITVVRPSDPLVRSFGRSTGMSGNNAIVGATEQAFFYRRDNAGNWSQTQQVGCDFFCFSGRDFGARVAISGDVAIVGQAGSSTGFGRIGSANIYRRNPSTNVWSKDGPTLVASDGVVNDGFGASVAISGDVAFVASIHKSGSTSTNKVYVFRYDPTSGNWGPLSSVSSTPVVTETQIIPFASHSVSVSGKLAAITSAGATNIYREGGNGQWVFKEDVPALADDYFGVASIAGDGVIAGALDQTDGHGSVYVSRRAIDVIISPPSDVVATDGTFDSRVQLTWNDRGSNEDGYRVYRDDRLIAELSANVETYSDFDVAPGVIANYCVAAVRIDLLDTERVCDFGLRPPDGTISGRIAAPAAFNSPAARSDTEATAPLVAESEQFTIGLADFRLADPLSQSSTAAMATTNVCVVPDPNRGLRFDGVGGYVAVPNVPLSGDKTMCSWIKTTKSGEGLAIVGLGSNTDGQLAFWHVYSGVLYYGEVGAPGFEQVGTPMAVNTGQWVHACAVKEGSTVTQYINGVAAVSAGGFDFPVATNTTTIGATRGNAGPSSFFEGAIDEVKLWDRALTPTEIAADMDRQYTGDESGLAAYWPFDQGAGNGVVDKTINARHGTLTDGVGWTDGSFKTCVEVNTDGNFTIDGLLYRESATFTVTPKHPTKSFEPATKEITLKKEQPIENQVDFTDKTLFPVSGLVQYQFEDTTCPVPDVPIFVNGINRGSTDEDGSYSVSLSPSSDPTDLYRLKPTITSQDRSDVTLFTPEYRDVFVDGTVPDINFLSTKKRTLRGYFGGSCDASGNLGSAEVRVFTENGCFDRTYTVSGDFELRLPPQQYLVQVTNVHNAPTALQANMIRFFDDLGAREVDLTAVDDTLDFIFRPNLVVDIAGLPAPVCGTLTADNRTLPSVPIIGRFQSIPLTISVKEDYGNGNFCTVKDGSIQVFDAIADSAGTPKTFDLELADGIVEYETFGASPNITAGAFINGVDRSYQKSITAVANVVGKAPASATKWAVVEGTRIRTAEFISATTDPFPLMILRDPPGSNSSAFIEKGTTSCTTMSGMQLTGGSYGANFDVALGFKSGAGFGFFIEQGAALALRTRFLIGRENSSQDPNNPGLQICATTTERLSTSTDPSWTGEDLYMGVALNLIFARADQQTVTSCNVEVNEILAADLKPDDAFETTYVYGRTHIEKDLIPALEDLIVLAGGATSVTGDPNGDGTDETVRLSDALDNWRDHLVRADSLENEMINVKNRSFSSGADYEYSFATDTVRTVRKESTRIYTESESGIGAVLTGFGYDQRAEAIFDIHQEWTSESDSTSGNTQTIGYTFSDGDTGDFFTVDVGEDPRYGTPVFKTRAGRSSNPWEPNTQRRDWPEISVNPPVLYDVDPDEAGNFELTLTNRSENNERRQYMLAVPGETNPRNLGLTVTGDLLGGERLESFTLEGGESRTINLDVLRVSPDYSYENVALMLYPANDYEIWKGDPRTPFATSDTAFISVYFDAPCSEIAILRPENPWYFSGNATPLQVILDGFSSDVGLSDSLVSVGMDYRIKGQPNWYPAISTDMATLGQDATSWSTAWTPPQDGEYQLRARTECVSTVAGADPPAVYSEIVEGVVDTKAPLVFGTPEPADQILTVGRDISISFDEPIACKSIVTTGVGTNTTLSYASGPNQGDVIPGLLKACDGRKVILAPPSSFDWAASEGLVLEASIDDVTDLAGNELAGPATKWLFSVRRSAFVWSPANVDLDVTHGTGATVTAQLVNGRAQQASFEIPPTFKLGSAAGDTAIVSPTLTTGTVVAGGAKTVSFVVPDTLAVGTYTATINATRIESGFAQEIIPLFVTANVVCAPPPSWVVNPASYEYSMTLTARLNISGSNSTDGNDRVVAMVGNEVRGVANIDNGLVTMLIYSNVLIGETVRFEVWDDSECLLYNETNKAIVFENNTAQGSLAEPASLGAPLTRDPAAINLAAGWTWMSLNKTPADASIAAVMSDVVASPGDLVKNNATFSIYDEQFGWVGTLENIEPGPGYQVYMQQSGSFIPAGSIVDLAANQIALQPGWNWIGYLPQAGQPLGDALGSLSPVDGDVIKSQFGFAQFDAGVWYGSLTEMKPGFGYQINVANADALTYSEPENNLTAPAANVLYASSQPTAGLPVPQQDEYRWDRSVATNASLPSNGGTRDSKGISEYSNETNDKSGKATDSEYDSFNERDFESSMTVTASVTFDGKPLLGNDGIVWVVDAEGRERGFGRVKRVTSGKGYRLFLMAYGGAADADELVIRSRHPETNEIVEVHNRLTFEAGAQIGSIEEPLHVDLSKTWQEGTETSAAPPPDAFALLPNYPNPFGETTVIHYDLPEETDVRLTVFDLLGREVVRLVDEKQKAGRYDLNFDASHLASGVYVFRIKAGEFVKMHKMTLVK